MMEQGQLPRLQVTTDGATHYRTVGWQQLFELMDRSTIVEQLRKEDHIYTQLPPLPDRILLLDTDRFVNSLDVILTSWVPSLNYPFVFDEEVYSITVPTIVCQFRWRSSTRSPVIFRMAVTTEEVVTLDSPLYRWPFSNVLNGESVCWTARNFNCELHEVVQKGVFGFLQTPNNTDGYGIGRSQNSSIAQYGEFLKAVEQNGGVDPEWLIPLGKTVQEFHTNK